MKLNIKKSILDGIVLKKSKVNKKGRAASNTNSEAGENPGIFDN
jgi:hypothetical protein